MGPSPEAAGLGVDLGAMSCTMEIVPRSCASHVGVDDTADAQVAAEAADPARAREPFSAPPGLKELGASGTLLGGSVPPGRVGCVVVSALYKVEVIETVLSRR